VARVLWFVFLLSSTKNAYELLLSLLYYLAGWWAMRLLISNGKSRKKRLTEERLEFILIIVDSWLF
jgi:hypothetical protein